MFFYQTIKLCSFITRIFLIAILFVDVAMAQPGSRLRELRRQHQQEKAGSSSASSEQTTLRIASKPNGTWRTWQGGLTRLVQSEVTIKNVGSVEARGIHVTLKVPGGARLVMIGPKILAPNSTETYHSNQNVESTQGEELSAEVACSNCR